MSTRKRNSLSLSSSPARSLHVSSSSARRRTRSFRNTVIQIAKHSKDRRLINRAAALAKQYKTNHKKENLDKLEALLRSQNARLSRSNSMKSADKDEFIDMLIKLTVNESPDSDTPKQILNRYLKR